MSARRISSMLSIVSAATLFADVACAQAPTQPATAATAAPPPPPAAAPALPPPVPFEQALLLAANNLFSKADIPAGAANPAPLVIDPLVDGMTGIQSNTTRAMERRVKIGRAH